jgi:hypothetical protein
MSGAVEDTACVQVQLTAISTALPMSALVVVAECVILGTHESVRPEVICLSEPLEKTGFTNL